MTFILKVKAAFIKNKELLSPAYIAIENGIIQKISSTPLGTNILDHSDKILLPGLTNAHCHLELTALGPLPKAPFTEWLRSLLRVRKTKSENEIQKGIKDGIEQLAQSGVTTILDHISHWTKLEAYQNTPVRVIGFGEIMGANFENAKKSLENLEFLWPSENTGTLGVATRRRVRHGAEDEAGTFESSSKPTTESEHHGKPKRDRTPMGGFSDSHIFNFYPSPHAIYSIHPEILKDVLKNKSHPFSIHMAESEEEKNYFKNFSGPIADFVKAQENIKFHDTGSGFEFYQKYCPNLNQTLFIHGNDFLDSALDKIAKLSQKCIVHCPGSFDFFDYEHFPFEKIIKRGIPLALGTDSLASNTGLNMLTEIRCFLKKYSGTSFEKLLPMVTTDALEAISIYDVGKIEEGYHADLIGFDWDGKKDLKTLFFENQEVDFVMSGGKML